MGSEKLWETFAAAFGIDTSRPEFAGNAQRVRNRQAVIEAVEEAFADFDAEPLLEKLRAAGIPAGKVRTLDEVYEWEQVHSQGLVIDVDHPVLGKVALPGPPLRFFSAAEGTETTNRDHLAPPLLDQHGGDIRSWLGSSPAPGGGETAQPAQAGQPDEAAQTDQAAQA